MPRWLFQLMNPLVPALVRRWLLRWLFDDLWPRWHWLAHLGPWAMAFGVGRYPQRVQ